MSADTVSADTISADTISADSHQPVSADDLSGKVVLVTGASKGIGLAVARDAAGAGAQVLLNARAGSSTAEQALEQVRVDCPNAAIMSADVSAPSDVDQMFRRIRAEYGRLDALVSNAGVTADGYAVMMGEQKWRKVLDTNLTGSFLCLRAAARMMLSQRSGSIVAVASTSGMNAPAGQANYAASKAGLLALVKVLAKELGGYGPRVNAVVPGFVDTAMTRGVPREQLDGHLEHVPLGRIGQPADVAPVVRFLLSDAAAYITGTSVTVDGGLTC